MNIGIDLDGVLFDTERHFRCYAHIFDFDNNGKGLVAPDEFTFQHKFQWSEETFQKFIYEYMLDIMKRVSFMPGSEKVIDLLKQQGHKLFIITARGGLEEKEIEITKNRLKNSNMSFDGVFYGCMDKVAICKQEKIDYMIDDSPINVKKLSENGIKCIYFRDHSSPKLDGDNITEVISWGEIYKMFKMQEKIGY